MLTSMMLLFWIGLLTFVFFILCAIMCGSRYDERHPDMSDECPYKVEKNEYEIHIPKSNPKDDSTWTQLEFDFDKEK